MPYTKVFSEWCIIPVWGGNLQVEGYVAPNKGRREITFSATEIVTERLGPRELKCADGNVIQLQGDIAYGIGLQAGLPAVVLDAFKDGFPPCWTNVIYDWIRSESISVSEKSVEHSIKCCQNGGETASGQQNGTGNPATTIVEKSHLNVADSVSKKARRKFLQVGKDGKARTEVSEKSAFEKSSVGKIRSEEERSGESHAPHLDKKLVVVLTQKDRDMCKSALSQEHQGTVPPADWQGSISKMSVMRAEASTHDVNQTTESRQSSSKQATVLARRQIKSRSPSMQKAMSRNENRTAEPEGSSIVTAVRTRNRAKMMETRDCTSNPSAFETNLDSKKVTLEKVAPSTTMETRGRKRTKMPGQKDSTSDCCVSKTAPSLQKKGSSPIVTAKRTRKQRKLTETKDNTNRSSILRTGLQEEHVTSEIMGSPPIVTAVRTRKQTKDLDTNDRTSGPSVLKITDQEKGEVAEKAKVSSSVTAVRTRKQKKTLVTKDSRGSPSITKTALQKEGVTSNEEEDSSIVKVVKTRKRRKNLEMKDNRCDHPVPKTAVRKKKVTPEKAKGISVVTAAKTRKRRKTSETKYDTDGPSVPKIAPELESTISKKTKGSHTATAVKTRMQRKALEMKDHKTVDTSASRTVQQAKSTTDKLEGPSTALATRKQRKITEPKNLARDPPTQKMAPCTENTSSETAEVFSGIQRAVRRKETKVAKDKSRTIDSDVLRLASHTKGIGPTEKPTSSPVRARTRRETKMLKEKSDMKDKSRADASSTVSAGVTGGKTGGGESVSHAVVHNKNVEKKDVVKVSTGSKPAVMKTTKSKMGSKAATAPWDDDTLRGSPTSGPAVLESDPERTLQPEPPKITRKRAIPAKSLTAALCGSKQPLSNITDQLNKGGRTRQMHPVTSRVDKFAPTKQRCTTAEPKKALQSSSGSKKRPDCKEKDAVHPDAFAITARRGTLKRKIQFRRAVRALAANVADDVFADEHGVGQMERGRVCSALVLPSESSDDELEVAGMHTPSLSSLQCSPTRSTFSDSRSSLSSTDFCNADKNLLRMEKQGKKEAVDVLTSTPIAPKRKMKQKAFLKVLTHAERKMLELEEKRNFENSDTELDYFSDVSSAC